MPTPLISRTDISAYKQISDTSYDDILNEHSLDAQFVDVQKLLGSDFYNDIVNNPATTPNAALLNGGTYTYQGTTYTNHGLKAVIVHYAFSRYILFGSSTDTPFGFVEKITNESKEISIEQKKTRAKANQQTAFTYWENVRLFLERNATNYPLWNVQCTQHSGGFRISKII